MRSIKRWIAILMLISFLSGLVMPVSFAVELMPWMPLPGTMVHLSARDEPALMAGLQLDAKEPFRFNFLMKRGQKELTMDARREEYRKLVKYFLAALTIPNKDMWVNLSPFEHDRIISDNFGLTEMGRDLLAQDYLLKQITASLIHPEEGSAKGFWKKVYAKALDTYGTTDIPLDTFNKVWIVPETAIIYHKYDTALVVESHLKVRMEQDYLALEKNRGLDPTGSSYEQPKSETARLAAEVVREIVIPLLEKEVNEGEHFAPLRQVYSAMLMATWFKKSLKESVLYQVYADRSRVAGVELDDPQEKEQIYQKYLQAYKVGVFSFIKEDLDPMTQEVIPRKYFSGGTKAYTLDQAQEVDSAEKLTTSQRDYAAKAQENGIDKTAVVFDAAANHQQNERVRHFLTTGASVTGYENLTDDDKKGLQDLFIRTFEPKATTVDMVLGHAPTPYALSSEQKIASLITAAKDLTKNNPTHRIVSLGRTPLWFIETARLLDENPQRFEYLAFSGRWYEEKQGRLVPGSTSPNREQTRAYREYLKNIGLDPESIVKVFETKGQQTVLVEYTQKGESLMSILSWLSEWASEMGLERRLKQAMVINILQDPILQRISYLGGYNISYQYVDHELIRDLANSDNFDDSLGIHFPYWKWTEAMPSRLKESPISLNAALVRFKIIDFLKSHSIPYAQKEEGARLLVQKQEEQATDANVDNVLKLTALVAQSVSSSYWQQTVNFARTTASVYTVKGVSGDQQNPWFERIDQTGRSHRISRSADGTLQGEVFEDGKSMGPMISLEIDGVVQWARDEADRTGDANLKGIIEQLSTKGGIDLDEKILNMKIKRDGAGMPLPLPMQDPAMMNIEGLSPAIIDIAPANALPIFTDLKDKMAEPPV